MSSKCGHKWQTSKGLLLCQHSENSCSVRPKKGECQEYSGELYWGRQIAPNPLVLASNKFYIILCLLFRKAVIDRGFFLFQREKEVDKTRSRRTILFPGTRGTAHACTKRPTPCYSRTQKPQHPPSFQSLPQPPIINQKNKKNQKTKKTQMS